MAIQYIIDLSLVLKYLDFFNNLNNFLAFAQRYLTDIIELIAIAIVINSILEQSNIMGLMLVCEFILVTKMALKFNSETIKIMNKFLVVLE